MVMALTGWPVKFTSCRAMGRSYSTAAADNIAPGTNSKMLPTNAAAGFMSFACARRWAF
jgi:hypothetical protein